MHIYVLLFILWFGGPLLLVCAFLPPSASSSRNCQRHLETSSPHDLLYPWTRLKLAADGDSGIHNNDVHEYATKKDDPHPLFVETRDSSVQSTINGYSSAAIDGVPFAVMHSIERIKESMLSITRDNTGVPPKGQLLKQIVQAGIQFQQNQTQQHQISIKDHSTQHLSYPNMERVPGCVATVYLKATLIPLSDFPDNDPNNYRVIIEGNADALLSSGLLAVLSDTFSCGTIQAGAMNDAHETLVTASDILNLDPEVLTTAMDLQSVLSRGRNDGMASMVTVIQRQIKSVVGEGYSSTNKPDDAIATIGDKFDKSLPFTTSNIHGQKDATHKRPTVAMLLSGGVDSSVSLHLLLRQKYNVTAFYLRIWLEDELAHLGECPWEDDLQVCQAVCEHAGNVPLETVSLGKEYRERVVQYTIEEAQRGRTPNPDIMCNSRVKFGCFLEYIEQSGMKFDYIASGHYARLEDEIQDGNAVMQSPKKRLFRAPDPIKDQSYFLCALTQHQLSKVIFPIGGYKKSEVRELATNFQLPNRNRPDSQGLCFLGKVRFDDFLSSYLGNRPGDVVDALNGEIIGRHNGMWYHTVGQRKGIGKVMFPLATAKGPWYVVAKDQKRNIVYVSNRYEEEDFARARSQFEVEDVRWISGEPPLETQAMGGSEESWQELRMEMKIRHGPTIVQGTLILKDDGSTGNISLDKKDGGLAPGQYVVFYRLGTDECLGAGVISEKHWAKFLQNYEDLLESKAEESGVAK